MNFSLNATSMYDKNGKPLCICNKTNCIVECFLLILFFYCLFRGVLWKSDVKFLFLFTFKINRSHRNLIWLLAFDSSSMFTYWVTCFFILLYFKGMLFIILYFIFFQVSSESKFRFFYKSPQSNTKLLIWIFIFMLL